MTPVSLLFLALAVGVGRTVEEIYLGHRTLGLSIMSHYAAFYLATLTGFSAIGAVLLGQSWRKTVQVVALGVLAGLLPPLIDVFWLGLGGFHYSYLDRFYPTLHGAGNPYSEAIVAWSALGAFSLYIYIRGRSLFRALLGLGLAYAYLVLIVTAFPDSLKAFLGSVSGTARTFMFLFLAYGIYVGSHFRRFKPSLKRVNHSLPWVVLIFLGATLAGGIREMTWLQALIVLFVHQGIVFANDYYDRDEDTINQRTSLLDKDDVAMIHGLIAWMAVQMSLMKPRLGALYILYILVATAYHHPAFRLKRILPLNYMIEGLVAALALLIGMASTDRFDFTGAELMYVGLAFAGFAAASPFKDYKDIPGDEKTGTQTLYVFLKRRGWGLDRIHTLVSATVLCFLAVPAVFLYLKGVSLPIVGLMSVVFVVSVFFSLRHTQKTLAVERTAWLLIGYLVAAVLALHYSPAASTPRLVKDYGGLHSSAEAYSQVHPSSLEEIVAVVRKANQESTPIRIRGKAHSMNGSTLPRANETLLLTDRLRSYRFEEPDSITVGAGMGMYELRAFLEARGYALPVVNDGIGGPSVGGYIAAGGIGSGSRQHGGFWENVLEMTLVTGAGEVLRLTPKDDLFPWMFGSMGQLGVIVSAKLKILGGEGSPYPFGEEGTVPPREVVDSEHLLWFTLFVPTEELETAKTALHRIREAHAKTLKYRRDYVYPIKFARFHPKLVFPLDQDFVGVGVWGKPMTKDTSLWMAVERDVMDLVKAHRDKSYRRYIQTEIVAPDTDYRAYFGDAVYEEFLALKKRLDPNFLLACGTVFACGSPP